MFLNIHSKNPKRLSLQPNFGRQTYLSYNSHASLNKEKSYSAASLKDEFRKYKNKSLSHALSSNTPISQIRSTFQSPSHLVSKDRRAPFNGSTLMKNGFQNGGNLKINDFKKSYLNLDSKLSKSTKPKDYFKPISEISSNYVPPASYIDASKRFEQENIQKQLVLLDEITLLRNQNQILKRETQELRKQRSIDLDLIARQNEIMQKQQELIEASQEAINAKTVHQKHFSRGNDHGSYTFSNNMKANSKTSPLECQNCVENKVNYQAQFQLKEIRVLKMEEENKYLKNEIHELVYQCQKYKEALKKAEEKYQKELQQNQKLIALIRETDKQKSSEINYKKSQNRQIPINYQRQNKEFVQSKPISLKRDKGKILYPQNGTGFKSNVNSPKKNLAEKSSSTKSAINLLKFSDQTSDQMQNWQQANNEEAWKKRYFRKQEAHYGKKQTNENKIKQSQQNMEWCQNQNIRKYLSEINKQKAKQIDKIDYLLSHQ